MKQTMSGAIGMALAAAAVSLSDPGAYTFRNEESYAPARSASRKKPARALGTNTGTGLGSLLAQDRRAAVAMAESNRLRNANYRASALYPVSRQVSRREYFTQESRPARNARKVARQAEIKRLKAVVVIVRHVLGN